MDKTDRFVLVGKIKMRNDELYNFYLYEVTRRSGKYNMITEAKLAAKSAGLDMVTYRKIIREYSRLQRKAKTRYGSIDKFMEAYYHQLATLTSQ